MEDQDPTLKLPKHTTPPQEGATDSQMQNLMAAGAGAFAIQPTSPPRIWEPPTLEQLQQALPQYEISAFIARGGMGAVYKGTQKTLKRPVAIKVLPPEMEDGDMQFAARFKHKAQAMAQLSHPNIVAVFEAGEVDGILYFVMEFIDGTDLAQLIATEGRFEPQRAIQITSAVCEALAFAHEEGIVHRDIKPSNIMIDKRGRVKVADFGLAKAFNLESTLISRSDVAMGTPDFIAPEAMMPGMNVDGRADLYAVGVMLYQMLTGAIPRGRFPLPSAVVQQIDPRLDSIVDKAMQTDRERRYSTANEIKMDLRNVTLPVPTLNDAETQPFQSPTPAKRRPLPKSLIATSAVILCGGVGAFWVQRPKVPSTSSYQVAPSATADTSPAQTPIASSSPSVGKSTSSSAARTSGGSTQQTLGRGDDRQAAEWAFDMGGKVVIRDVTGSREIQSKADLPKLAFDVLSINLSAIDRQKRQIIPYQNLLPLAGLRKVTAVSLTNLPLSDDDTEILASMPELTRLLLSNAPGFTGKNLGLLRPATKINWMNFPSTGITPEGVRQIAQFVDLTGLQLGGKLLGDKDLVPLQQLKKLMWLNISETRVTIEGWKQLKGLPLTEISAEFKRGTARDWCIAISALFPDIGKMDFYTREAVLPDDVAASAAFPRLKTLILSTTYMDDALLGALASLPKLEELTLRAGSEGPVKNLKNAAMESLLGLKKLQKLRLEKIDTLSGPTLTTLAKLKFLKTLEVSSCPQLDDAALADFKAERPDVKVVK